MFRKLHKEANNYMESDKPLKESTVNKPLNIKGSKKIFKIAAIIVVIGIILSKFLLRDNRININTIAKPIYPKKIGFEDFDEQVKRREDIDENFLKELGKFSIKSSSLVLSRTDKDINSLYSPISLYMALSMAAETANGETQEEILRVLNMDSIDMVRSETGKLFRKLYYHNEIGKLSLGNSIWLNKDVRFNINTLDLLAKDYYASSFSLDFNDNESSKKISKWVSNQIGGKLKNRYDDFSLNQDDVMTLVSTIYFYDEWVDRFNINDTKEDEFYLEDGNIVKSDFMNMKYGSHSFVGVDGYTVSHLNLKNNGRMIFILPDEGLSPFDIISDPQLLDEAINSLSTDKRKMGEVIFKIPKFKFLSKLKLKDICEELGIKEIFQETSDFTSLSDTKPLFISDINQSSTISIDEKGVEATAYTKIDYAGAAQPNGRAEMILNRPFIFAITDVEVSPLFIGIINNPNIE
ncbi:serpin family protein [uncultured Tissierella sp.]|jgi:serine protease inhibitor|uniref:serpin family protein n=1 Tax=uncultured Tissierella sp. TaxID=448160 RepID=UPI0028055E64|nr:serpin family protein [uncultured Tissierella sp.]MDU5082146.1 serpin family protein [Bacillota bacterium]